MVIFCVWSIGVFLWSQRQGLMRVPSIAATVRFSDVGYRCVGIFVLNSEGRQEGIIVFDD